jgi:hypothetical protein
MNAELMKEYAKWRSEQPEEPDMTREEMLQDICKTLFDLINTPRPKRDTEEETEETKRKKREMATEIVDILAELGIIRVTDK